MVEGDVSRGEPKNYFAEVDSLRGGVGGLIRLADSNNTVNVDIDAIEKLAADPGNRYQEEYQDFLAWRNSLPIYNGEDGKPEGVVTKAGGKIAWGKVPEDAIYITKSQSTWSRRTREGKTVEDADWLRYTSDTLDEGILKVEHPGDPTKVGLEQVLDITGREELLPNQYVVVNNQIVYQVTQDLRTTNKRGTRFQLTGEPELRRLDLPSWDGPVKSRVPGIVARNLEQRLLYQQLVNPNTELCIAHGGSGTGKTVLALAAATHLVLGTSKEREEGKVRDGIRVFKTTDLIGGPDRAVGFLPGDIMEKLRNFMKSYEDAHYLVGMGEHLTFEEMLLHPKREIFEKSGTRKSDKVGKHYFSPKHAALTIGHLPFDVGRTFEKEVVIVDEAPNYSPYEMQQLLGRIGEGTKVILLGDIRQIHAKGLDKEFNGMVWAANALWGKHPRMSIINLDQNFRSQTASLTKDIHAPRNL